MSLFTRREFVSAATKLSVLLGVGATGLPKIVSALEDMVNQRAPVLWLQGQSCSGCSVSFINSDFPSPVDILTRYITLRYHSTLSTATGDDAISTINRTISAGRYILIVEGSVPAAMPDACVVGHEPFTEQLVRAARNADLVVALGTCASHGGIPAAENNPTGAMGIGEYLEKKGVQKPTVVIPGCPAHPHWIVGTLVYALKFGVPAMDRKNRPTMFFAKTNHDHCPRFADYEREKFAKVFGEDGCLFLLGCLGPNTYADCSLRNWNSGVNSCIKSGSPCIGCAGEDFSRHAEFPFYRITEKYQRKN